ncbi:hypothetical protein MMC22_007366 [Lobaria immixta]|nr:hypothetical protein [Lobaria immixta]
MESDNSKPALQKQPKAIHWRSAMMTLFRLKNNEGLVNDEFLAALKITLHPPSFPTTLSPELKSQIDSYMSRELNMTTWQRIHEYVAEINPHPLTIADIYCAKLGHQYTCDMPKRRVQPGGYSVSGRTQLKSPKMGLKRRRQYHIYIDAAFLIQYGFTLPYRTCGIAQSRHPGELALSATEVLSLLILAIDCHKQTPGQPSYMVRVLAADSFYVRRLTAIVPATYIRILLQSTKKIGPDELIGNITVEQTPYFDFRDPEGLRAVFVALFEDEDKVEQAPRECPNSE